MAEEAIKIDSDSILARMVRDHQGELEPGLVVEAALAGDQRAIHDSLGSRIGSGERNFNFDSASQSRFNHHRWLCS